MVYRYPIFPSCLKLENNTRSAQAATILSRRVIFQLNPTTTGYRLEVRINLEKLALDARRARRLLRRFVYTHAYVIRIRFFEQMFRIPGACAILSQIMRRSSVGGRAN